MASYRFLVFSNPEAGRDDEFNRWYSDQHLNDLLKIPGVTAAQRFRVADDNGQQPHRYLALYEIETDNLDAVMADITGRFGTDAMPMTDTLDEKTLSMLSFVAITERRTG